MHIKEPSVIAGAALVLLVFCVPALAVPPSTPSPTGRTPRLLWTPARQATWNRMRAFNHPWWQLVQHYADLTGTPRGHFGDNGMWAAFAYQVTGNPQYASKAWSKIAPHLHQTPRNANWTREYFVQFALMYDWLYPALTPQQRKDLYESLNYWSDLVLHHAAVKNTTAQTGTRQESAPRFQPRRGRLKPAPSVARKKRPPHPNNSHWGTRTGDSDEVIGHYFGLATTDLATGPDNPRAGEFLKSRWPDAGQWLKPVGGLYGTAADRTTLRNTISQYIHLADGGVWIESSQYNLNTLKLLLTDVEAVRTASEKVPFPELKPLLPRLALEEIYELTPDLRDSYQWGDQEHAHDLRLLKRMPILQILAGLTQGDQVGPYIQQLVLELTAMHGYHGLRSAEPLEPTGLLFFNPYAPHADWRAALPPAFYAPGMGILLVHDGWRPTDSLFGAQMSTHPQVDHEVTYFGDFRLYRRGEWVIDHPLGYGALAVSGEAVNTLLLAGLSSMQEVRGPVAQETGKHGEYAYIAGTSRGRPYARTNPPILNPRRVPPAFVHEWTRSLVYLPSADKQSDTVVVFDRVNAEDPRKLPGYKLYRRPDRQRIEAAPALKQWLVHSPLAPNVTPEGLSWRTPGNQLVQVRTLLPAAQERKVYNETELWGKQRSIPLKARRFQTRLTPARQSDWDTFLNVIHVSDQAHLSESQLVESKGKEAQGALVQRAQQDNVLVLFGARPQARILDTGYGIGWSGRGPHTSVHLFDLSPSRTWSVAVDGGPATPLTVSSQGVGHVLVAGSGVHTLKLTAR